MNGRIFAHSTWRFDKNLQGPPSALEFGDREIGKSGMPTVSRFPGIVIAVNYGDQPPPHFHVRYGEHRAMIGIEGLQVLRGQLPLRVLGLMIGWAFENATELNRNWELAERRQPLAPIPPWSELWFRK